MEFIVAVAIGVIVYIVQTMLYRRLWDRNLTVRIQFEDECVMAGSRTNLLEVINNAKFLPMAVFHVKFSCSKTFRFDDRENSVITDAYHRNDAFSVMGNQKVSRKLSFVAERRGYYEISSLHILTRDFFLANRFARKMENDAFLYVLPGKRQENELAVMFQNLLGEILNRRSLLEDPYTFRGIREYDHSDSIRSINWKATARANDLMVNIHERASEQRVKLLLNLETNTMIKREEMQEIAIEITSTVAQRLIEEKLPVSLTSNGMDVITREYGRVASGCTYNHMLTIDRYLARISDSGGMEDFLKMLDEELVEGDKNISYIIVSPYFKKDLIDRLDAMTENGLYVQMIVPYYDIQLPDIERAYIHELEVKLINA